MRAAARVRPARPAWRDPVLRAGSEAPAASTSTRATGTAMRAAQLRRGKRRRAMKKQAASATGHQRGSDEDVVPGEELEALRQRRRHEGRAASVERRHPHLPERQRPFYRSGGGGSAGTTNLTHYYVEVRAPHGFDRGLTPSAQIRVSGDIRQRTQGGLNTWFLDMHPATSALDGLGAWGRFTDRNEKGEPTPCSSSRNGESSRSSGSMRSVIVGSRRESIGVRDVRMALEGKLA